MGRAKKVKEKGIFMSIEKYQEFGELLQNINVPVKFASQIYQAIQFIQKNVSEIEKWYGSIA